MFIWSIKVVKSVITWYPLSLFEFYQKIDFDLMYWYNKVHFVFEKCIRMILEIAVL